MFNWRVNSNGSYTYHETLEGAKLAASAAGHGSIVEGYVWGIGWTIKIAGANKANHHPSLAFDHRNGCGKITGGDFIHAPAYIIGAQDYEIPDFMKHGWLVDEWSQPRRLFQSRSTRVAVPDVVKEPEPPAHIHVSLVGDLQWHRREIKEVYRKYQYYKGFSAHLPIDKTVSLLDKDRKVLIAMRDDLGKLVAFTLVRLHCPAFESIQFCWDYENPKLELGKLSQEYELYFARKLGCDWVYLGPAYEKACLYKSKINGVQWWDGSEWCNDTEELARLLERDSKLETISEIMNGDDAT